jgi:hypothetical protein
LVTGETAIHVMVSQDMVAGAGELVEDGKKSPVGRFGNAKVAELDDGIHLLALHGIHERLKAGVGIMDDVLVDIGDDSDPELCGVGARRANGQLEAAIDLRKWRRLFMIAKYLL